MGIIGAPVQVCRGQAVSRGLVPRLSNQGLAVTSLAPLSSLRSWPLTGRPRTHTHRQTPDKLSLTHSASARLPNVSLLSIRRECRWVRLIENSQNRRWKLLSIFFSSSLFGVSNLWREETEDLLKTWIHLQRRVNSTVACLYVFFLFLKKRI